MTETQRAAMQAAHDAIKALREWVEAVPDDTPLPAMPGVDGDWLDDVEIGITAALAEPEPAVEPVGCIVRHRSLRTPASIAFDGIGHYSDWSEWRNESIAYGRAVTCPSRNTEGESLYEMKLTYTAPPSASTTAPRAAEGLYTRTMHGTRPRYTLAYSHINDYHIVDAMKINTFHLVHAQADVFAESMKNQFYVEYVEVKS